MFFSSSVCFVTYPKYWFIFFSAYLRGQLRMVSGLVEAVSWIKTLFASVVLWPKSFLQRRDLRSERALCFGCFSPPALQQLEGASTLCRPQSPILQRLLWVRGRGPGCQKSLPQQSCRWWAGSSHVLNSQIFCVAELSCKVFTKGLDFLNTSAYTFQSSALSVTNPA